jgi:hypothetical protein
MSAITITKLYDLLIPKVGKEAAENLTTYIESKIDTELEKSITRFATKEDLANAKGELLDKIGESRTEIIRWMFVFWVGQLAGIVGIMLLFLRK